MSGKHRFDHSHYRVGPGKKVRLKHFDTSDTGPLKDKAEAREALKEDIVHLSAAQELLWASKEYSLIVIFQALDAAGKDGTIKHVMSGVNPQGVDVHSFKAPNDEERLHHFLWRPQTHAPERGRIAIFNRSYYEEVLVVRVHPEFLDTQWLPNRKRKMGLDEIWKSRYEDINSYEKVSTHNNVLFLKFFLHVSKKEQKKRFMERLDNPDKNWKFSAADIAERNHWEDYVEAYEEMLSETSTEWAPWYVIPADKKWFSRACVADIIATRIQDLDLSYPTVSDNDQKALHEAKIRLMLEDDQ